MVFINETSYIGAVVVGITNNVTGDLFFTLLGILIFLIIGGLAVGMPLELVFPLTLPYVLLCLVVSSAFLGVLAIYVVFLGLLIAKNFWLT